MFSKPSRPQHLIIPMSHTQHVCKQTINKYKLLKGLFYFRKTRKVTLGKGGNVSKEEGRAGEKVEGREFGILRTTYG